MRIVFSIGMRTILLSLYGMGALWGFKPSAIVHQQLHSTEHTKHSGREPIQFDPSTCAHTMQDFFERFEFGASVQQSSKDTSKVFRFQQGNAEIFQATQDIYASAAALDPVIYEGEYFYIDLLHKDHLEVFGNTLQARAVINLDGTENIFKKQQALQQKRILRLSHGPTETFSQSCYNFTY